MLWIRNFMHFQAISERRSTCREPSAFSLADPAQLRGDDRSFSKAEERSQDRFPNETDKNHWMLGDEIAKDMRIRLCDAKYAKRKRRSFGRNGRGERILPFWRFSCLSYLILLTIRQTTTIILSFLCKFSNLHPAKMNLVEKQIP